MNLLGTIAILFSLFNVANNKIDFIYPQIENIGGQNSFTFQKLETQQEFPKKIQNDSIGIKVDAKSVLVKDLNTDKILFSKNKDEKRQIASITKLMSAIIIKDLNIDPNKIIEITITDNVGDFSKTKLSVSETVKFADLLSASLITSSNNGIITAIKNSGLSEDDFVKKMNEKAKELGLKDTYFEDATGLSDKNISTANDVLIFTKNAFSYPDIKLETSQKKYSFNTINSNRNITVSNTNELIGNYLNIKAGKTGYTDLAGFCLVSEVEYEDKQPILVVVLGSNSHYERFSDLKAVSTWVFNNYKWKN